MKKQMIYASTCLVIVLSLLGCGRQDWDGRLTFSLVNTTSQGVGETLVGFRSRGTTYKLRVPPDLDIDDDAAPSNVLSTNTVYRITGTLTENRVIEVSSMTYIGEYTPRPVDDELITAVKAGNLAGVTAALAQGADPNAESSQLNDSDTPSLFHLCESSGLAPSNSPQDLTAIASRLIEAGADVNAVDYNDYVPLHNAAAYCRDRGVIDVLIAAGADPSAKTVAYYLDGSQHTPLSRVLAQWRSALDYRAADAATRVAVIEALLEHGAEVQGLDKEGLADLATYRERVQQAAR
jgi:hypothetical protein